MSENNPSNKLKTTYYVIQPEEVQLETPNLRDVLEAADRKVSKRASIAKTDEGNKSQFRNRRGQTSDEVDDQINTLKDRIDQASIKYHVGTRASIHAHDNIGDIEKGSAHSHGSRGKSSNSLDHSSDDATHYEEKHIDRKESYNCPVFRFLNINPAKDISELEEDGFLEILEEKGESCSNFYHFEHSFPKDWLPPLHMACCLGFSYPVIKKIYKQYPNAIHYVSDHSGMNVLHYATLYTKASIKVINFLIKKYSESSKENGIQGWTEIVDIEHHRTPLHMACSCPPSKSFFQPEVILLLTEVNPRCAKIPDKYGNTPLHLACQVDEPSYTVIDDLTTVYPDACMVEDKTKTKSMPLHHILCHPQVENPSDHFIDIVKDLIKSCPASLKVIGHGNGDILNYLPIFMAIDHNADIRILKALIKRWPDCLEETDNNTKKGKIPYEYAKDVKNITDPEILELLNPYEEE